MGHQFATKMGKKQSKNRAYYTVNQPWLQKQGRERMARGKAAMSKEQREEAHVQHNENAARYHAANQKTINEKAAEVRCQAKCDREQAVERERKMQEMKRLKGRD
ncbi:hypothetical protein DXG01_006394 [Tephrocybe rancida]|nr:hypothetical protein DXG01_006394 [Tephrocybe rancida]